MDVAPLKLNRTFRAVPFVIVSSFASLLYFPYNVLKSEVEHDSSFCKYDASNFGVLRAFDFFDLLAALDDLVSVLFGVAYESFEADSLNVSSNAMGGRDCSSD